MRGGTRVNKVIAGCPKTDNGQQAVDNSQQSTVLLVLFFLSLKKKQSE